MVLCAGCSTCCGMRSCRGRQLQARAQQEVLRILSQAHPSVYGKLKELNGCEQVRMCDWLSLNVLLWHG